MLTPLSATQISPAKEIKFGPKGATRVCGTREPGPGCRALADTADNLFDFGVSPTLCNSLLRILSVSRANRKLIGHAMPVV
jgi:hypothetical protein